MDFDHDETPHPDAGMGSGMTRREEEVRDDGTERVYVEWFVGQGRQSFTRIQTVDETGDKRVLAADVNELGQLLRALRHARERLSGQTDGFARKMVRDLGIERVFVERDGGFAALVVEELGEVDRALVVDEDDLGTLIGAIEQAKDELPSVEVGPHV